MNKIIFLINVLCIFVIGCCLWFQILLPYSYIFTVIILAIFLTFSIIKNGVQSKIVVLQLLLVFFLLRNIFYISTKNLMPFGDAFWDYAVEKTFLDQGYISTIQGIVRPTEAGGISQLTWYSGWPFLHTFGVSFSLMTGLDAIYLNLILSNILALISFIFVYLFFEKLRVKLNLFKKVTIVALLLYVIFPEAIFWQMQLVRQSFALALFTPIIYLLYVLSCEKFDYKYCLILGILVLSLVVTHHVTSFTLVLFLVLFSILNILSKRIGKLERLKWAYSTVSSKIFLFFGELTFVFMILWWIRNSNTIIPTVSSRIILFIETLGLDKIYSSDLAPIYPSIIKPPWVPILLGFRDLILFVSAFIGFLILWRYKSKIPEKFFIIYSILAFGFILIINVVFSIEPLRIILFMAPFLAFLAALFFGRIQQMFRKAGRIIISVVLIGLIVSSFLGLWAHGFAPIHLYDPSINPVDIGESTPDFMRVKSFFENNINISNFNDIRADLISRLVYLLDPEDFDKIKSLPIENISRINKEGTLVCSFNDLNLYQYFGYIWSPIEISDAKIIQQELKQNLENNFHLIYNDGSTSIWTNSL